MSGLPEGWVKADLGAVATVTSGIGFPNEHQGQISGDLPFVKVGDVSAAVLEHGGRLNTANHYVSREVAALLKGQPVRPGATVFAKIGEAIRLNRRAYVVNECLIDNNVMAVTATDERSDRYVHYFLRTVQFADVLRATTVPSLRKGDVESLAIPLAPLPEQKRIADKLDSVLARVDACRDRLDRIPALLKRFRQSVLVAATSGRLTEDWRAVNVMPPWRASDIQSVAQVATGSTPLRSNSTFYAETGTPWITSAATSQPVVIAAEQFVTDEAVAAHRLKVFPVGTLLVAMYGEGKTRGQVTELGLPATINQACAAVVVDEHMALRGYVKLVLQANYMQMRELAEGGNQPNLNLSKVKEFPLLLPPLAEQHEIVRRVETLFAFADRLEARCAAARKQAGQLTPALLAKAFRGELVPQDPADEPAAELLKRLAARRADAPKAWRGKARASTGV
ncbi:restriction endonuclease subunit S [Thauera propionica]|uniref:restriction endonuclease subunit S n=1 Tax=Thauera propionica TaxID=2019431 RepID=UPI0023EFB9BC|nr:restriction endonuclease subunit S [Thauera propionica]MDD3674069.1 restriction endonuclease subunit S [Thauera propionica]